MIYRHKNIESIVQLKVIQYCKLTIGFPGGSEYKEFACNAGDLGLSLDWEDPLLSGYPLQYLCLENSIGACWATVHGVTKSQTQLSD